MITIKSSSFTICLALLFLTLLTACQNQSSGNHEIPYDRTNASKHIISVRNAAELTAGYREGKSKLIRQLGGADYLDKNFNLPDAELFNRDAIAQLLNQKGAKGMRIYLGQDKKGLVRLVLVAVDEKGDDITSKDGQASDVVNPAASVASAVVLEAGQRCPTMCSATGPIK
ncbi:MAG: hypothetical protein JKY70_09815 [Mucilaginibacter sp.]|nr:hypothetical protein [Mucilaginibacter sp.]